MGKTRALLLALRQVINFLKSKYRLAKYVPDSHAEGFKDGKKVQGLCTRIANQ
ncbi:hypothetical protein ZEAMMB73_Zm00001d014535 [Zea mays]|uniref:Uncharacterized protein n=1 Tax=Zea mays TaxID=4577 RepID=A0A1D6GU22_MAIZE|nr:hypothetical protein ZEAMMB73_Zm00001d014535 [Zea mays]